jgi:hypothetical protein
MGYIDYVEQGLALRGDPVYAHSHRFRRQCALLKDKHTLDHLVWKATIRQIKDWLKRCMSLHNRCQLQSQDDSSSCLKLPTRLLYVSSPRWNDSPRFGRTIEGGPLKYKQRNWILLVPMNHATLSYCWGKVDHTYKTTSSNLEERGNIGGQRAVVKYDCHYCYCCCSC